MDSIKAARVLVFAYIIVLPFVDRRKLAFVQDPFVKVAALVAIGLLTALDVPLALLTAVAYLLTEVFRRTHEVKEDALARTRHACRAEFERAWKGPQKECDAAPAVPFLTPAQLEEAGSNLVPGAQYFEGIRYGKDWASPQGLGDTLLPATE